MDDMITDIKPNESQAVELKSAKGPERHDSSMLDNHTVTQNGIQPNGQNLKEYSVDSTQGETVQSDCASQYEDTNISQCHAEKIVKSCETHSEVSNSLKNPEILAIGINQSSHTKNGEDLCANDENCNLSAMPNDSGHSYTTTSAESFDSLPIHTVLDDLEIDLHKADQVSGKVANNESDCSINTFSNHSSSAEVFEEHQVIHTEQCEPSLPNNISNDESEAREVMSSILDQVSDQFPAVQNHSLPSQKFPSDFTTSDQSSNSCCNEQLAKCTEKCDKAEIVESVTKLVDDIVVRTTSEIYENSFSRNLDQNVSESVSQKPSDFKNEDKTIGDFNSTNGTAHKQCASSQPGLSVSDVLVKSCAALELSDVLDKTLQEDADKELGAVTIALERRETSLSGIGCVENCAKNQDVCKASCIEKENASKPPREHSLDDDSVEIKLIYRADLPSLQDDIGNQCGHSSESISQSIMAKPDDSRPTRSSLRLVKTNKEDTSTDKVPDKGNRTLRKSKRKSTPLKCVDVSSKKQRMFLSQRPKRKTVPPHVGQPQRPVRFIMLSSDTDSDSLEALSPRKSIDYNKTRIESDKEVKSTEMLENPIDKDVTATKPDNLEVAPNESAPASCDSNSSSSIDKKLTEVKDSSGLRSVNNSKSAPKILSRRKVPSLKRRLPLLSNSTTSSYKPSTISNAEILAKLSDLRKKVCGMVEKQDNSSPIKDLGEDIGLSTYKKNQNSQQAPKNHGTKSRRNIHISRPTTARNRRPRRSAVRNKDKNSLASEAESPSKVVAQEKPMDSQTTISKRRLEVRVENCKDIQIIPQTFPGDTVVKRKRRKTPDSDSVKNKSLSEIALLDQTPAFGNIMTKTITRSSCEVALPRFQSETSTLFAQRSQSAENGHLDRRTHTTQDLDFRYIPKLSDILSVANSGVPTCCFCHLPSNHLLGLGDLFGPYRPLAEEVLARQDSFNEHLKSQGSWPECGPAYSADGSPTVTINRDSGSCFMTARVERDDSEVDGSTVEDLSRAITKSSHHLRSLSTIDHILQDSNCKTWRSKQKVTQAPTNNVTVRIPGPKSECKVIVDKHSNFNAKDWSPRPQNDPIIPNINSIVFLEPKIDLPHSSNEDIVPSSSPSTQVQSSSNSTRRRTRNRRTLDSSPNAQPLSPLSESRVQDDSTTVCISHNFNTGPLWTHGYCAVWADGVYAIRGQLYGLWDAVRDSAKITCALCNRPGATIVSFEDKRISKQYGSQLKAYHYPCALIENLKLNWENLTASR